MATLGCSAAHALVIAGSDLLGEGFRKALQEELAAAGVEARLALDGSLRALRELEQGTIEAALLALPEGTEGARPHRRYPVAYQIVALAVHATNPVIEVNYGQLLQVFQEGGAITSWSQLTPAADWRERKVNPVIWRPQATVALELFSNTVLQGANLRANLRFLSGRAEEVSALILNDPTALVLGPALRPSPSVRFLAVRKEGARQAYTPSADNVFFGDYPLRLPVYLELSPGLDRAEAGKLLQALYSDRVTQALEEQYFVTVPEPEQRAILMGYE